MENQVVKKQKLYEEIVDRFLEQIKSRDLKPGDRLPPERQMAETMGVSRTVIREALRSLESMGYIEQRIGDGTFVRVPSISNLMGPFSGILVQDENINRELIDVRVLLECEIARLACTSRTEEQLTALRLNLETSRIDAAHGGLGVAQDYEFHKMLAAACGNATLCAIFSMCADLLLRTQLITQNISGQSLATVEDHQAIYDAVAARDSELAGSLMQQHLQKARSNLERGRSAG